jgi:hypothetical protein
MTTVTVYASPELTPGMVLAFIVPEYVIANGAAVAAAETRNEPRTPETSLASLARRFFSIAFPLVGINGLSIKALRNEINCASVAPLSLA